MGATHFHARRVGEARARAYELTGAPIMAKEAARIGLIAECVDDDQLMGRALELVRGLAAGPRQAFLAVRELMATACTSPLAEQLEREAAAQGRLADSPDFLEGIIAFREKRPAKFGQR